MWLLVGRLVLWAKALSTGSKVAIGIGGAEVAVTLNDLRERAKVEAGASDIQALDEAARTAARMLGMDGSEVLWPMDRLGNHIAPKYFHVDLMKGRAWFTSQYFSRKSASRGRFRRGSSYTRMNSIATARARQRY